MSNKLRFTADLVCLVGINSDIAKSRRSFLEPIPSNSP